MKLLKFLLSMFIVCNVAYIFSMQQAPMQLEHRQNNCWFNALMQCLMHSPKFNERVELLGISADEDEASYGLPFENYRFIRAVRQQEAVNNFFNFFDFTRGHTEDIFEQFQQEMLPKLDVNLNNLMIVNHNNNCGHVITRLQNDPNKSFGFSCSIRQLGQNVQTLIANNILQCGNVNPPEILLLHVQPYPAFDLTMKASFPLTNLAVFNNFYRLTSVSFYNGYHYVACVRSGNTWYYCDDINYPTVQIDDMRQLYVRIPALNLYIPSLFFYEKLDAQDQGPANNVIIQPPQPVVEQLPPQTTTPTFHPQVTEEDKKRIKELEKQLAIISPFKGDQLTAAGKLILRELERAKKMYVGDKNKNAVEEWAKLFKKITPNWQQLCEKK